MSGPTERVDLLNIGTATVVLVVVGIAAVFPARGGPRVAIRDLNRRAFGHEQEGRIVDVLRANGSAQLSLVAIDEGRVAAGVSQP